MITQRRQTYASHVDFDSFTVFMRKCYFPSQPDGHLERSWAVCRLPVIASKTTVGGVWGEGSPLPQHKNYYSKNKNYYSILMLLNYYSFYNVTIVPTQNPTFVVGVLIVCQLLPTPGLVTTVCLLYHCSHVNAHPQCLGHTEKLFFQFIFFGCFFTCVLLSPSGVC